jgi:NAD(P)-dependent dehydrogenase (short-subunit alcohol dehydrogenase family)
VLKSKRILVAGASGGIGAAVVEICAGHGAEVWAGYSSHEAPAQALAKRLTEAGSRVHAISLDLKDPSSIAGAVAQLTQNGSKIDGLINCAGIHVAGPLASLADADLVSQLQINLEGAIRLSREVSIPMVRQRSGVIVNLGSVAAHRVARGHAVYSATKAGLEGFTRALASELAKRGIRVCCVVPGPVMTPMLAHSIEETGDDPSARVPLGRTIEPSEVAQAAAFLVSDLASAITGVSLAVDGGYCLW